MSKLHRIVLLIIVFTFSFAVFKSTIIKNSKISEESVEEVVKLSECEGLNELNFGEFDDMDLFIEKDLSRSQNSHNEFYIKLSSNYTEPSSENLYSPPEIDV